MRIPGTDQLARTGYNDRIRAAQFHHRIFHSLFRRRNMKALPGDQVGDHFRIDGRLKNSPRILHLLPEFLRVYQIAIVGKHQRTLHIIQYQRLYVLRITGTCRRIPHMADPDVSF